MPPSAVPDSAPLDASPSLDIEKTDDLIAWLRHRGIFGRDEPCTAKILRGGVSNKAILVQGEKRGIVVKQALGKLRVAVEWHSDPARIQREALGLRLLEKLAPAGSITPFIFEDEPLFLLGMEAVPEPHENWKTVLLRGEVTDDAVWQFGNLLGQIHSRGAELDPASRATLEDRRFFEQLRVEPYYGFTASHNPSTTYFYRRLIDDMSESCVTVVHGDFSPKNILVYQGRLVLLDHEVIHWGDPTFDLGFALTHLLSKANHLAPHRQRFLRAARNFWQAYLSEARALAADPKLESRACRQTLACLLSRVDGRSPLEYLAVNEKAAQKQAVLELMQKPPSRLDDLIHEFGDRL
jgi:tRNA A-37 threonylcarbamoyl transferase component Bud32